MTSEFDKPLHCFTFEEYLEAGSRATKHETWSEKDFEKWERYHDSIVAVLKTVGIVSMEPQPLPDFYHSGDWFDTYTDGFSIENEKILTPALLLNLVRCVAAADPGATLEFAGVDGNVDGLHIFISSEGAFAYWNGLSALQCEERVIALGH